MTLSISRLRKDFSNYYAPHLLKVRDEHGHIVPFFLREEQKKIDAVLERGIKDHRVFIFALKSRQVGISTWAEARLFHRTHMFRNAQTIIMAHEAKASDNIFNMTKRYYDHLPKDFRPMVHHSNKKELTFENPSKDAYDNPGLKSRITVFTAGTKDSARSFTADCGHLSEFAFYPDGAEIVSACEAGIPEGPGHFLIAETTGNGVGNFAYDLWHHWSKEYKRKGDRSEFVPFFLGWWEIGKYSRPFDRDSDRVALMASLDDVEKDLVRKFKVTPEQLNWRRNKLNAYAGDVVRFMREFPAEPEEAFISSGRPVFNPLKIQSVRASLKGPLFRGEINHEGDLLPLSSGRLLIWEYPQRGKDYVVGVDPKGDSDDPKSDECVIEVVEKDSLVQVAEWVGMLDPVAMTPYVKALGIMYGTDVNGGEALVAVERNNSGISVLYELDKDYHNIYMLEKFDEGGSKVTKKLGWETNVRTKPMLIDFATFCFHSDYCAVRSEDLLTEMSKFTEQDSSTRAESGASDNRVMAWMIALFVAGKGKSTFQRVKMSPYVEPIKEKTKYSDVIGEWREAEIDMDELTPELLDVEEYDSWLAY